MKILIVDDDEISRDKVANVLSAYGDCTEAKDGADALCHFGFAHGQGKAYDLVTMDVDMPGLRGQEVVKALRRWEERAGSSKPETQRAQIVMLTAMSDAGNIFGAYRELCDDYIVKPVTAGKVRASLAKLGLPVVGQQG